MISGIGVIESGLGGISPTALPFKYTSRTYTYQLPYFNESDLAKSDFLVSQTDEERFTRSIENQLKGIARTHWNTDAFVTFEGSLKDKSNHPANNIIVTLSGIEAYINQIYVGAKVQEVVWSGLEHSGTNYLWIGLIEENLNNANARSSRQYRDVGAHLTFDGSKPEGPENSLLVGTYISGTGFNANPLGKSTITLAGQHVYNNKNPHSTLLNQDYLVSSGVNSINYSYWPTAAASGTPAVGAVQAITYRNGLTQNMYMICSGILGNILSGNLTDTPFANITDLEADPAVLGNVYVASGMSISGSFFRSNLRLVPGKTVDGLDFTNLIPLTSGASLSGIPRYHSHSLLVSSGLSIRKSPKYGNLTLTPQNAVGPGQNYNFEYNFDLGTYKPTLRHKKSAISSFYLRQLIPTNYNQLESISIEHRIDSGSPGIGYCIRDCLGTAVLSSTSGLESNTTAFTTLSGFPQTGFGQHRAFDLELTFNGKSGISQYLGDIFFNFKSSTN